MSQIAYFCTTYLIFSVLECITLGSVQKRSVLCEQRTLQTLNGHVTGAVAKAV